MKEGMPWVEKYRPEKLSDVVGQEEISKRLESYVKSKSIPHLLFSGPAGVGKTSCAVALAKELYPKGFERNFLELNASDERGIDVVRSTIKEFARTLAFDTAFKIIFLDESDALTPDAQQALRRTMEKYTKTCRFILSANYSSRIIEPIQSRTVVFRFKPLAAKDIEERIKFIASAEGLSVDSKALEAINYVSAGDMRKAVNVLQSCSFDKKVTEKLVYDIASKARPQEVRDMMSLALKKDFIGARKKLYELLYSHGMSGEDVMLQMYRELTELDVKDKVKAELIGVIGEYNFRLVEGANERIQLEALLAQFMMHG